MIGIASLRYALLAMTSDLFVIARPAPDRRFAPSGTGSAGRSNRGQVGAGARFLLGHIMIYAARLDSPRSLAAHVGVRIFAPIRHRRLERAGFAGVVKNLSTLIEEIRDLSLPIVPGVSLPMIPGFPP
jgi:hypothetical protein